MFAVCLPLNSKQWSARFGMIEFDRLRFFFYLFDWDFLWKLVEKKKEIRNNSSDNLTGARAAATFQSYTFFQTRHENIFRRIIVLTLSSTFFHDFVIWICFSCSFALLCFALVCFARGSARVKMNYEAMCDNF